MSSTTKSDDSTHSAHMAKQRVALITGCSHLDSLGYCLALILQRTGWKVIATARNTSAEGMKALAKEGVQLLALDVNDGKSIEKAVEDVDAMTGGRLDLLVNNAGVVAQLPTLEQPLPALRDMFETNVFGPLHLIQLCTPMLIRTTNAAIPIIKSAKGRGKGKAMILNIGSTAGEGMIWHVGYAASKAAMNTLSETLRREIKGLGIEVITAMPGRIKTNMTSPSVSEATIAAYPKSRFYPNLPDILSATLADLARNDTSVPTAEAVAAYLVKVVERGEGGRVYPGFGGWIFQYVYPWLPLKMQDMLWGQLGHLNLVQRVVV